MIKRVCGAVAASSMWIRLEAMEWFRAFLRSIPGEIGCWVRAKHYGFRAGRNVRVLSHVFVYHPRKLVVGHNVGISPMCQINAGGGIKVGDNVLIGPGCMIWSQNHRFSAIEIPICEQEYEFDEVVMEDDVWMGAGAIVLPGVRLGKGTVVAAGAVVTRSTEPYTIVAGVPAKCVGRRSLSPSNNGARLGGVKGE
jgi:maltose O-acetyltransferase